jgi:hypothetical protein
MYGQPLRIDSSRDAPVTLAMPGCAMRQRRSRTGVCVVKIESRLGRLMVTVRTNSDVDHIRVDEIQQFAAADAAIEAVRVFLARFGQNADGTGSNT